MTELDGTVPIDLTNFEAFLTQFDAMLESDPSAALRLVDGTTDAIRAESEWALCRAEALLALDGAEAAVDFLVQVVTEEPDHADAHHHLAELYTELHRELDAIAHHLETLRLDTELDLVSESAEGQLAHAIVTTAEQTLQGLPATLSEQLGAVPVVLTARPSEQLIREGLDSRALGLFEGPTLADMRSCNTAAELTRITIFTGCLMQAFGLDEAELLEQVRITVLHEVAHFFGLDEDDLEALELD